MSDASHAATRASAALAVQAGRATRSAPLPHDLLRQIADELAAHAGLAFGKTQEEFLARAVDRLLAEVGPLTTPSLVASVRAGGPLLERLLALATVAETYFFRDLEELEILQREFLRPAIQRGSAQRPLRIWSAGCATGEETYSLAVLLGELGDGAGVVLGTDLNPASLSIAREAVYGRRSFRAPLQSREHWFETAPGGRRVVDVIRRRAAFLRHNLTEPLDMPLDRLGGRADAIVCRNVLLYLNPAAREAVIGRLFDALEPGGWLLVAPVELMTAPFHSFERLVIDGRTILRRPPKHGSVRPPPAPRRTTAESGMAPDARSTHRGRQAIRIRLRPARGSAPAAARAKPQRPTPRDPLGEIWALADSGGLGEARARCEALLAGNSMLAPAYECLATIAEAQDDSAGAVTALRRLIYLRPDDAGARFRLALLEWRRERPNQARALFESSLKLLEGRGIEELVDERTRLTVARARQVAAVLSGS